MKSGMQTLLIILAVIVLMTIAKRVLAGDILPPDEVSKRLQAGTAVLVDVREPDEWQSGVVDGAHLLPLSDLRGDRTQWTPFLKANAGQELILYCRSGNRSGMAKRVLDAEKFPTANAGGFSRLKAAGLPVTPPRR